MKRIYYILIGSVLASSCSFLDVEPQDFSPTEKYFESADHLEFALAGAYEVLSMPELYSTYYISEMGNEADEGYNRSGTKTLGPQIYAFNASNTIITDLWKVLYDGIGRANIVIENYQQPKMDDVRRNQILGEALFLRAYYHFLLVAHWGNVPLVLHTTSDHSKTKIAQSPGEKVYEAIEDDLKRAEPLVADIADLGYGGRANKSAVRGMLARIYLHWAGYPLRNESKYAQARAWALKVMDPAEGHELNPSYEQVFKNYASDSYDIKESLFEVEFWGNLQDAYHAVGRVGNVNGVQSANNEIGHAYGYIRATQVLYNLYEAQDLRRDWAICPYTISESGAKVVQSATYARSAGKFRREYETCLPRHRLGTPINFPILRYSDVLLMFAEAENHVNGPTQEAHDALNLVRERANASLFEVETEIDDKDRFQKVIQDERARELCFEALRKLDLIRWDILVVNMRNALQGLPSGATYTSAFNNVSERDYLLPIPTRELSLNRALVQNRGW